MVLTTITKPFGLLDKETQRALITHNGQIEEFTGDRWVPKDYLRWEWQVTYRAKPEPPKPREWWIVGECEAWDSREAAEASARMLHVKSIIHVREVLD